MGDSVVSLTTAIFCHGSLEVACHSGLPGASVEANHDIVFFPDIALGLASSATDHLLLLPFYYQAEGNPHIRRRSEKSDGPRARALSGL